MMENIKDFISAAVPWITLGLALALFFAREGRRKNGKKLENYAVEGMCLGMCIGVGISSPYGLTVGMAIGLLAGSFIEKKGDDKSEEQK